MNKKILVYVFVIVVVIASAGWYWSDYSQGETELKIAAPLHDKPVDVPQAKAEPLRELPAVDNEISDTYQLQGSLPTLAKSDTSLFAHLRLLLPENALELFNKKQFIRKFVLQIDNAAQGRLVYQHSPFIEPLDSLAVDTTKGLMTLNPSSFKRYDEIANLAEAVDTDLLIAYYSYYEPLFNAAFEELGYNTPFRLQLVRAIDEVLAAPLVEGPIKLMKPEANYVYANPQLESLSMVQQQMLRMGPKNTQKIQRALKALRARIL